MLCSLRWTNYLHASKVEVSCQPALASNCAKAFLNSAVANANIVEDMETVLVNFFERIVVIDPLSISSSRNNENNR